MAHLVCACMYHAGKYIPVVLLPVRLLPEQTFLMWLFVCSCFHVSTGKVGAPNLRPGELTLSSPPELCPGLGHLSGATEERLPQPSLNPGESIDASMAAGLKSVQVPQGELLVSINVKWCRPQANTKIPHAHTLSYTDTHTRELMCEQMWWRIVCPRGKIWRSDLVM